MVLPAAGDPQVLRSQAVPLEPVVFQHAAGGVVMGEDLGLHAVQAERIYTPPSLLDIAVPDFSMPYNIILFYSTYVALFFGSMLNAMVRRFHDVVV